MDTTTKPKSGYELREARLKFLRRCTCIVCVEGSWKDATELDNDDWTHADCRIVRVEAA